MRITYREEVIVTLQLLVVGREDVFSSRACPTTVHCDLSAQPYAKEMCHGLTQREIARPCNLVCPRLSTTLRVLDWHLPVFRLGCATG